MYASEYLRRKIGKANYSDFKRRLENKPQGCIIQCSKVNCKLNYPGYEFRDSIRVGKGQCDCTEVCFLETGAPLGDGILLGDMMAIQNEPQDDYIVDENGDYIIVEDPENPYELRTMILAASEAPLVIAKKSIQTAQTVKSVSVQGYIKELPYKIIKASNNHIYVIGHCLDGIMITTPTQVVYVNMQTNGTETSSMFILKVDKETFEIDAAATVGSPAPNVVASYANIVLSTAQFVNNKLYIIFKADSENSPCAFAYRKANQNSPLEQVLSTEFESGDSNENIYFMELDAELHEDPYYIKNVLPADALTVMSQMLIGEKIYYTQSFNLAATNLQATSSIVNNKTEESINFPKVNQAVSNTDNYMYTMEVDPSSEYDITFMRSFRSPEPIYALEPIVYGDSYILFSGLYSSRIFCEQNDNVTLSRYNFTTNAYAGFMYCANKAEDNIMWGSEIEGTTEMTHIIPTETNAIIVAGTFGDNGCKVYDEEYYTTGMLGYTQTSTNTAMNTFIAKYNNQGLCYDLIKLSGNGTVYKPLYLLNIAGDEFILIIKANSSVTFTRLVEKKPTEVTGSGTMPIYIVKYNKDMNCMYYASISMNDGDMIRDVRIEDSKLLIAGITSVENPMYTTMNDKKFKIDTPVINGKRAFKLKIRI